MDAKTVLLGGLGAVLVLYLATIVRGGLVRPTPLQTAIGFVTAFLDTLGLRPGVRVEVREKHPFDGPLVIRVDGHDRTIGHRVANQIYVKIDERDAPPAPSRQHGQQHRKEQLA